MMLICNHLNLRRDILLILFCLQYWIYIHAIPTLNSLLPNSEFAFPSQLAYVRLIRFTIDSLYLYAIIQSLCFIFFFLPLIFLYLLLKEELIFIKMQPHQTAISNVRLLALSFIYSLFGILFFKTAIKTGLLSPYAANVELFASLSRYDFFIWRIYIIAAPFLISVVILAFKESIMKSASSKVIVILILIPGIICHFAWLLCSSRLHLLLLIMAIAALMFQRQHIRHFTIHTVACSLASVLIVLYSLSIIPQMRGIILQENINLNEIGSALNPFDRDKNIESPFVIDYGVRLDGVELMALATPKLVEKGPLLFSGYFIPIISPILPLFPELEYKIKVHDRAADSKLIYMKEYTEIQSSDYIACSLTELYVNVGPVGLLGGAFIYSILIAWISKLFNRSGISLIVGIYLLFNVYSFESQFASLFLGWFRILPILMLVLLLNPWQQAKTNLSPSKDRKSVV